MKSLAYLTAGTLAFWGVVFYPARLVWGDPAVLFSAVACLLCLVPCAATLIWSQRAFKGSPEQQLLAVLGGTAVRMLFVIGAGVLLYNTLPDLGHASFLIWVIVFYLFTLFLEMGILLTRPLATTQLDKQ